MCVCVYIYIFVVVIVVFWPHGAACGILVPQTDFKPVPPAWAVQSITHWTTREVTI